MLILYIILGIIIVLSISFLLFPYRWIKTLTYLLRYTIYRVNVNGVENIPAQGPALFIANHVSIFDGLIIIGASKRKVHLLMNHTFYQKKYLKWFFKSIGIIEVPNPKHTKKMRAFWKEVQDLLSQGELVCTYPEGGVSGNGLISSFKSGINQLLPENISIPIIPIRLGLIHGSLFAVENQKIKIIDNRSLPVNVNIKINPPIDKNLTAYQFRQYISEMGADAEMPFFKGEKTIHYKFLCRAKRNFFYESYKDFDANRGVSNFMMLVKSLIISRKVRTLSNYNDSDIIGVMLPNCTNLVALLFGILYADKTPAILNFSSGIDTINKVVEHSKIKVIITSKKFLNKLNIEQQDNMIFLEDVAKEVTKWDKIRVIRDVLLYPSCLLMKLYAPKNQYDLNNNLVILYSSGSTGIPKGVMLSHHNLNSNILSFARTINWHKNDKILGSLPIFHAYGFNVCFVFSAVEQIQTVYVLSPLDSQSICDCIEHEKCTMMMATPTFLQNYIRRHKKGQFKSLKLVITGAEKLRKDISTKFKELTNLEVVEGFGCTELSPIVSINLSQHYLSLGKKYGKTGSIGPALPGLHVKIVNPETFEECDENQSGLLLIKGASVMKGYLNNIEATKKAMYQDYYITGDIGSMSKDGYITITGRLSRFSKIAGEMVPHEVVETLINQILQSQERKVVISSRNDNKRGEKLIAFYTDEEINPAEIVDKLRQEKISNLWIPKVEDFVKIHQIPILGSGKIDLQELKKLASNTII